MNFKKAFSGFRVYFYLIFIVLLLMFISVERKFGLPSVSVFSSEYLNSLFVVFVGVMVWLISPAGFLSFIMGRRFSKKGVLNSKIFTLANIFSVLTWLSMMTIIFIVYVDDVYIHILNFGSEILYLALYSGFIFGAMLIIRIFCAAIVYKESLFDRIVEGDVVEEFIEKDNLSDSLGSRIKNRIKKDLKDIINDEIDKRF